jgi:hypothetical protein
VQSSSSVPRKLFPFGIVLLTVLFTVPSLGVQKQKGTTRRPSGTTSAKKVFGVSLRPELGELLKDVEEKYKRPVCFSKAQSNQCDETLKFPAGAGAVAYILNDGTPTVVFETDKDVSEVFIAYELFHLQSLANGTPIMGISTDKNMEEKQRAMILRVLHRTQDIIEHMSFYPKMRKMKLKIDDAHIETADKIRAWSEDTIEYMREDGKPFAARAYFSVLVECGTTFEGLEKASQLYRFYKDNKLQDAIDRAEKAYAIASSVRAKTEKVLKCTEALFGNSVSFAFEGSDLKKKGAVIEKYDFYLVK